MSQLRLVSLLALMLLLAGCGTAMAGSGTAATPTPTAQQPMPDTGADEPPRGPGVALGKAYPFAFGGTLHCGVEPVRFDGRYWMAVNVPEEWTYTVPSGWTSDDSNGEMTLVSEDLAVYTSRSGIEIAYRPRPVDTPYPGCF